MTLDMKTPFILNSFEVARPTIEDDRNIKNSLELKELKAH